MRSPRRDALEYPQAGQALGLSHTSVQRIWNAHELKPHLVKTFKLSNDKRFVEKVQDVVGLYLDPPDRALVFSVDEKSQIQALDRTQPGLPMKKGRAGTMTHDYKRHGTTTLFAALDVATGRVIGQCMKRHRHQEWLKFLRSIDRDAHKGSTCISSLTITPPTSTPRCRLGLSGIHGSTCTSRRHRRRGSTKSSASSAVSLPIASAAVSSRVWPSSKPPSNEYLDHHNAEPKPFVWTASAAAILEKVARGRQVLESVH